MYALSYDMDTKVLKDIFGEKKYHNYYYTIRETLEPFGFYWVQHSVLITNNNDLANLFLAVNALKTLEHFNTAVRDVRVFEVKNWSDFTPYIKG